MQQLHDPAEAPLDKLLNPAKEGNFYDDCPDPACGNRDVPMSFKNGGLNPRNGERYHSWSIFHCDCCGVNWSRDSRQGTEERAAKGQEPAKGHESSVILGRTVFYGASPAYRDNYERIFGHD